jgi:exodeoxyribonuclease III
MKMVSWNVNGIRAAWKKGLPEYLESSGADLVFLQETKAHPEQLEQEIRAPDGWGSAFGAGIKKGYSGVAALWRLATVGEPDEVQVGLGVERFDAEGRVVMVRYGDLCVFGNYFPNGGKGPERVDYKLDFYDVMLQRMNALRRAGRDVVVCGDFNTAHRPVDLARPQQNRNTSGFLAEERAWMDRWLADGWVDTFRHTHPDTRDVYTWWSYRLAARPKNVGWRIDYFVVDEAAVHRVVSADVHTKQEGSDHCPVWLELAARQRS